MISLNFLAELTFTKDITRIGVLIRHAIIGMVVRIGKKGVELMQEPVMTPLSSLGTKTMPTSKVGVVMTRSMPREPVL